MLRSLMLCFSAVFVVGCDSKQKNVTAPSPASRPVPPAAAKVDELVWDTPRYPKVEFFMNEYRSGPHQGSTSHSSPPPQDRSVEVETKVSWGPSTPGAVPCTLGYKFLGVRHGKDVYKIHVSYPVSHGSGSFERQYEYGGEDVEVWKDDTYRMGIRPYNAKD